MSEMAMTVKDNLPLLRQFSGSVFKEQFVKDLVAPLDYMFRTQKPCLPEKSTVIEEDYFEGDNKKCASIPVCLPWRY